MPRIEGGRGFTSIEDGVDALIQRLEDYLQDWLQLPETILATQETRERQLPENKKLE